MHQQVEACARVLERAQADLDRMKRTKGVYHPKSHKLLEFWYDIMCRFMDLPEDVHKAMNTKQYRNELVLRLVPTEAEWPELQAKLRDSAPETLAHSDYEYLKRWRVASQIFSVSEPTEYDVIAFMRNYEPKFVVVEKELVSRTMASQALHHMTMAKIVHLCRHFGLPLDKPAETLLNHIVLTTTVDEFTELVTDSTNWMCCDPTRAVSFGIGYWSCMSPSSTHSDHWKLERTTGYNSVSLMFSPWPMYEEMTNAMSTDKMLRGFVDYSAMAGDNHTLTAQLSGHYLMNMNANDIHRISVLLCEAKCDADFVVFDTSDYFNPVLSTRAVELIKETDSTDASTAPKIGKVAFGFELHPVKLEPRKPLVAKADAGALLGEDLTKHQKFASTQDARGTDFGLNLGKSEELPGSGIVRPLASGLYLSDKMVASLIRPLCKIMGYAPWQRMLLDDGNGLILADALFSDDEVAPLIKQNARLADAFAVKNSIWHRVFNIGAGRVRHFAVHDVVVPLALAESWTATPDRRPTPDKVGALIHSACLAQATYTVYQRAKCCSERAAGTLRRGFVCDNQCKSRVMMTKTFVFSVTAALNVLGTAQRNYALDASTAFARISESLRRMPNINIPMAVSQASQLAEYSDVTMGSQMVAYALWKTGSTAAAGFPQPKTAPTTLVPQGANAEWV